MSTFSTIKNINIAIVFFFLLAGCQTEQKPSTGRESTHLSTIQVGTSQVIQHQATNQMEVVGTIQAVEQAEISSKITGNIISFPVDLGSVVQKGELLVEISAGEISAQLQEARAQLDQAKRNFNREQKLLKKNASTPETVKSYRDSVRISEANFQRAKTMLDYTRITAPFSGTITQKLGNTGDLATPGKPLLRMEKSGDMEIITAIPEVMVHSIKTDDQLKAYIPAVDIEVFGTISEISPVADPSSRTTPIKIRIASREKVRSGQFARIKLTKAGNQTLIIPSSAIVPYGQMERVFVINDGKAMLRLVRTGARLNLAGTDYTEILSGLDKGQNIIISNKTLVHGQPVKTHN